MPCAFKSKIIVLGPSNSGKEFFFNNCSQISNLGYEKSYWTIGISIKTASCTIENEDYLTVSMWDINLNERFKFLYTTFFRGARGCLFFFDLAVSESLSILNYYLDDIRLMAGNIPIFIIGYSADSNNIIDNEELNQFVVNNYLEGCFLLPNQIDLIVDELGRRIVGDLRISASLENLKYKTKSKENKKLERFMKFFSLCPICGKSNHQTNLKTFYFSTNPKFIKLKRQLFMVMNNAEDFDNIYINKIKLGIPCCSCFNKVFPEDAS